MHVIERFVILLYDRTSKCKDVNKARKKLFAKKSSVQNIPPTYAALEQHVKRSALQGGHVWGQALVPEPCSLHQQTGAGIGVMMGPTYHYGPHSLRHPRPAMSWCLAAARKAAETAASARRLHCNALVCVSVKANASRLGQITC